MEYKDKVIELLKSTELTAEQKEKLEDIFPELAESEDEQTRIKLLSFVNTWGRAKLPLTTVNRFVNYLEKQGEESYASETMNEKRDFDNGFTRMMENEQKPWSEWDKKMLQDAISLAHEVEDRDLFH